ncbi:MAG: hypothetical protein R6U43_06755 [Candidatus Krumholzibacteriales bacterium]
MEQNLTSQRVVGIVILAWIAIIGFDFLLHGGILAGLYFQPSSFLLPPDKAFLLIPLGYLSFLIFEVFIVWLMIQLNITGWKDGLLFGLKVGAFVWGAMCLGLLSISTAGFKLLAGWFLGQTVEAGIGGLVAGSGFAMTKLGRLALYVLLFFLIMTVTTVVLQSLGFAPQAAFNQF